ncbi:MAG: hypothetical protein RLY31_2302 [Bacteroidota bacterium]|jgi:methionine aminotransferase
MVNTSKLPHYGTSIFTVMSALALEHGAINLSQGFPDFDCSEDLKKLVARHIGHGYNQYAPMQGVSVLRQRLADKMASLYGVRPDPDEEITITAGATQAIYCAITAFVRSDDEVILIEPAYDCYRPAVEIAGGLPVVYEMTGPDYRVEWSLLERLISWKTRMIIVNTPHNPTGKVFREEDWKTLQRIAASRDILVLSDEAYEHMVFDGRRHHSLLQFPSLFERGVVACSLGKTLHTTGWKLGCLVAPPYLTKEFRKIHQFNVFSVNTPMQYAVADYFSDPSVYSGLADLFGRKRDKLLREMDGSRFKPLSSEGSYFQLFDYSAISREPDVAFARRMTTEFGVAAIPVSVFYSSRRDEHVVRLCFAKQDETLERAGELLRKI